MTVEKGKCVKEIYVQTHSFFDLVFLVYKVNTDVIYLFICFFYLFSALPDETQCVPVHEASDVENINITLPSSANAPMCNSVCNNPMISAETENVGSKVCACWAFREDEYEPLCTLTFAPLSQVCTEIKVVEAGVDSAMAIFDCRKYIT